ncbi:PREDICTED: uncharacterized protein LOC108375832 [Rhagoletis zephyria]|uniref:uncharacterized protein LOC108375832 n=1 Tax=Rhagoletis zephyria TaxID=28612 RepID=UPI00081132E0|nr:PREDICTED: uncharacterized protein LOC108375832 [Rhagoletis zephyria]
MEQQQQQQANFVAEQVEGGVLRVRIKRLTEHEIRRYSRSDSSGGDRSSNSSDNNSTGGEHDDAGRPSSPSEGGSNSGRQQQEIGVEDIESLESTQPFVLPQNSEDAEMAAYWGAEYLANNTPHLTSEEEEMEHELSHVRTTTEENICEEDISKPINDIDDDSEKMEIGKLKPNTGNGCTLDKTEEKICEEDISKPINDIDDDSEKMEIGKLKPNTGNGCTLDKYSWTQTLQEVEVKIPLRVSSNLRAKDISVTIGKMSLFVGLKNEEPIINGVLSAEIKQEDSVWVLQDNKTLLITLEKVSHN